jgi:hypothetical protein
MKKTVKASELSKLRMAAGNEKKYDTVIHNGEVKDWVGIGWIVVRDATDADYNKFPEVKNG